MRQRCRRSRAEEPDKLAPGQNAPHRSIVVAHGLQLLRKRGTFGQRDIDRDAIGSLDGARLVSLTGRVFGQQDMSRTESHRLATFELDLAFTPERDHELTAWRW